MCIKFTLQIPDSFVVRSWMGENFSLIEKKTKLLFESEYYFFLVVIKQILPHRLIKQMEEKNIKKTT